MFLFFLVPKKNNKEINKSDDPIVGTWKLINVIYSATVNNNQGTITYTGGASNPRGNLMFRDDHTVSGDAAITVNCDIELSGNQPYSISYPNQKIINEDGTWSIIDSYHLSIDISGEDTATYSYAIHSNNELDMEIVYDEIANGQTVSIDIIYIFERQ